MHWSRCSAIAQEVAVYSCMLRLFKQHDNQCCWNVWPCHLAVMHFSSSGARKEGMPIYFWATTPVTTRETSPKYSVSWDTSNLHFFLGHIAQSQGVSMLTCGLVNNGWLVIVRVYLWWVGSKVGVNITINLNYAQKLSGETALETTHHQAGTHIPLPRQHQKYEQHSTVLPR